MSTPVSMTAMTVPSPFWVTWSVRIMSWALRFAGSCPSTLEARVPPSASTAATSLTCPSRSRNAAVTPGALRIASSDPAGALRAKPSRTLAYSRSTLTEAFGKIPATASFTEDRAAARSVPSASCTMMPTTRAGSWLGESASCVCPSFEVSAVLTSPTGDEAGVSCAGKWPGSIGEATDAGPVTTSASAPTNARREAGFFIDISLLH